MHMTRKVTITINDEKEYPLEKTFRTFLLLFFRTSNHKIPLGRNKTDCLRKDKGLVVLIITPLKARIP